MAQAPNPKTQALSSQLHHEGQDSAFGAIATWLEGKATNTRHNYAAAIRAFFEFLQIDVQARPDLQLTQLRVITPLKVVAWKENLKTKGMADSSIHNRLSIISSMFTYLQRPQTDGKPLLDYNPVQGVERKDLDVTPYGRARKITKAQFKQLLTAIVEDIRKTVPKYEAAQGKTKARLRKKLTRLVRDRAMILFYVLCARRRSEVVSLRGDDLTHHSSTRITYRTRLKRGKVQTKEMPPPVWAAINLYLRVAGRELSKTTPLFTATVDNGKYLRRHYQLQKGRGELPQKTDQIIERPLSGQAVLDALKKYARMANISEDSIDVHALRHFGAELYYEISGDILETNRFLDHARLDTTQVYLQQLRGDQHRHWQGMANELDVDLDVDL
jgi:integrase